MGNKTINVKFKNRACQIATGTFLTKSFTKDELDNVKVSEYVTEAFEYTDKEELKELILELANEIYLELISCKFSC